MRLRRSRAAARVGPTSRAWYEELRLAPVLVDALRGRGLDEAAAWWAAERVRLLLDLPLAASLTGASNTVAASLVDAWLFHPVARPFLRVNRWEGVDWFHGESFAELLDWADRLEAISAPARPATHATGPGEVRALIEAGVAASGYRVDRLREALAPERVVTPGARPAPAPDGKPKDAAKQESAVKGKPKAKSKGTSKSD